MLFTLCQRLIEHPRIGFEYDYMGAAEYEFGATRKARLHLYNQELHAAEAKVKTLEKTFDCVAIFRADQIEEAKSLLGVLASGDYQNKGIMAYSSRPPLGWLVVDPVPMLIHMNDDAGTKRARYFLDHGKKLFSEGLQC